MSSSSSKPPTYIYKILPSSPPPPSPLPKILPLSSLDARDKFIHMSTSIQLLGTLKNFFGTDNSVIILRVPYAKVEERVKWEMAVGKAPEEKGGCWDVEGKMGGFPHIYHDGDGILRLGSGEVESLGKWERVDEVWSEKGWPFGEEDIPKEG